MRPPKRRTYEAIGWETLIEVICQIMYFLCISFLKFIQKISAVRQKRELRIPVLWQKTMNTNEELLINI